MPESTVPGRRRRRRRHGEFSTIAIFAIVLIGIASAATGLACQLFTSDRPAVEPATMGGLTENETPIADPVGTPDLSAPTPTPSRTPEPARVLVANPTTGVLSIVDANTNQLTETINLSVPPRDVALTADGRFAVVTSAEPGVGTVVVFDLLGRQKVGETRAGLQTWGIALDPQSRFAFVANSGSDSLSFVDLQQSREVAVVPVGKQPRGVAYVPHLGGQIYVANEGDDSVSVVDVATRQQVATIPVGRQPVAIAPAPDGQTVYVANGADATLTAVDVTRRVVVATADLPGEPAAVAISPTGDAVYAAVRKVRREEASPEAEGGDENARAAPLPEATASAWQQGQNSIAVVDPRTNAVVGEIGSLRAPSAIVFNTDGSKAFVADTGSGKLVVVDVATQYVTANVNLDDGVIAVAFGINPSVVPIAVVPTPTRRR